MKLKALLAVYSAQCTVRSAAPAVRLLKKFFEESGETFFQKSFSGRRRHGSKALKGYGGKQEFSPIFALEKRKTTHKSL